MEISERGLELIRDFEGCELNAYRCPAKVWTIGYGHTGPEVGEGLTITQREADRLLRADLLRFEEGVVRSAGRCTQGQFDALVSFAFNVGLRAFMSSTLLKRHGAGEHGLAAQEFGRWVHAGGKRLEGLVRRRAAEAALYQS